MVFTNIFWKDGRSGKTGGFCKHKCSSLYNKAVDVIYIVCQEVAVVPDVARHLLSELHRPVRKHLIESIY